MVERIEFNPQELMKKAIEVMKSSVYEPRNDKISPSVGAVLMSPEGDIETASRGELRNGDHAEYTLIERKNHDKPLDGYILFATLEPCAPGAREPPKISCAERIVNARIKEVWLGIEDPDPTVAGKGIEYLQENGVTVHLFDREFQDIIREENSDFLIQAKDRAAEFENHAKSKTDLSSHFETITNTINWEDLSSEALNRYRIDAKIIDDIGSPAFKRRFLHLQLLTEKDGVFKPTFFGFLIFGKEPRNLIHQAGLLCLIRYPNGEEETHEFNEPLALIPNRVEEFLKNKLPYIMDRNQMVREESVSLPFELIREALINALVHRDYNIEGAKCQLIISEHSTIVKSPGGPISPITLEQMKSFDAPTLSRNPKIHFIFAQMKMAEEQRIGLQSFKMAEEKYNLPLPEYSFENPYLVLTIYHDSKNLKRKPAVDFKKELNKDELSGWNFLSSRIETTKSEYSSSMGFDSRKSQRHLKKFVDLGLLERIGSGPRTKYKTII